MKTVTGLLQIAAAAVFAADLSAAVVFDFAAEAPNFRYSGTMILDATNSKTDITSGAHPLFNSNISLITRKEGSDVIVVDHARKTYFQRTPPPEMRGPLSTVGGIGRSKLEGSKVTRTRERFTAENGRELERHLIDATYRIDMDVEGETMKATVDLHIELDVDPAFEQHAFPWGLQYGGKTGFPKVDWAIADRIPNRLPMRQLVRAARQISGGPVITETFTMTVSNVREDEVDARIFFAPAGYRYEEPVFSFGQ